MRVEIVWGRHGGGARCGGRPSCVTGASAPPDVDAIAASRRSPSKPTTPKPRPGSMTSEGLCPGKWVSSTLRLLGGGRKPALLRLVLAATVVTTSGCQETLAVGVVNRCGQVVEVDASSSLRTIDIDPQWTRISPGGRAGVRSIRDEATSVFIRVRVTGTEAFRTHEVALVEAVKPPESAEYETEVTLTGDRCP